MAASYPASIKSFTTKVDNVTDVLAAHVNDIQDEVVALETALGVGWKGIVQVQSQVVQTAASTTSVIPNDNTIPQDSEGAQALTVTITPKSSSNQYAVFAQLSLDVNGDAPVAALFHDQDGTANALASVYEFDAGTNPRQLVIIFTGTFSNSNAHIFSVRYGPSGASTCYLNSENGTQLFGGKDNSCLVVMEIKV